MIEKRRILGGLLGLAVGDALGLPVEFHSRESLDSEPVTGMRSGGTHRQPAGTWSDETGLAYCTVEALLGDYGVDALGVNFARWYQEGYWTPHGEVFDVGQTTEHAILRIVRGLPADQSGAVEEDENGNDALARTIPVALAFSRWSIPVMLERVCEAARVTNAHIRSQIACCLLALVIRNLAFHRAVNASYRYAMEAAAKMFMNEPWRSERRTFQRLLRGQIGEMQRSQISSNAYVVSTLEAALWALLQARGYKPAVLTAVNLGDDADTVASITGALAGIAYGVESIPKEWIDELVRADDLKAVADRFAGVVSA